MPLSFAEIRSRAANFARDWQDKAHYEKGQTHTFYNELFEVFGQRRRDVAVYERKVQQLNTTNGYIDLFWPGMLVVEQKSLGRNLEAARQQAMDYITALHPNERPRYLLLSDFQNFELHDFETDEDAAFALCDLADNISHLVFIAGYQLQTYRDQDPVNIEAANLMGNLHRHLADNGYAGQDLQLFLVRVMFCLFADDTGIFIPDTFLRFVEDRTAEDGSDLGAKLVELWETLNTPQEKRQTYLDESMRDFPYVNGQLFGTQTHIPAFNRKGREALLQCCKFQWAKVSPALFGSLFQTVMLPDHQREQGAHYTSEQNILKTIHPLFLDDLRAEFAAIKQSRGGGRLAKLQKFRDVLANLTFFDPACGCGNFLILAYRELRELELDVLDEVYPTDSHGMRQGVLDVLSRIDVDQFYGIELEEFPARIAETALWLVDHQMNMKFSERFSKVLVRIPLQKAPHIHIGNALRIGWAEVLPPARCSYILGNPPFVGSKFMSLRQREEILGLFADVSGNGVLDYVCGWYAKAADYINNTAIKVAFVSTDSITQGEQVGILWDYMCNKKHITINFSHQTFKWTLDEKKAEGMTLAAVYVVIIGFAAFDVPNKMIYEYERVTATPQQQPVSKINGYLVEGANVFIKSRRKPLCEVPEILFGNQPIDGGYLIFSAAEKMALVTDYPHAAPLLRLYVGAEELINGGERYVLWLKDHNPDVYKDIPPIIQRLKLLKEYRSGKIPARGKPPDTVIKHRDSKLQHVSKGGLFASERQPDVEYIVIPSASSERREYIPLDIFSPDVIASNLCLMIPNATLYHFGLLHSKMHMAWVRAICGRLGTSYRYSNNIVYNNFPWPKVNAEKESKIAELAQAVLDARKQFPTSQLDDIYDPLCMPPLLRKAHNALDRAVDKAYRKEKFASERERVEFLFARYLELTEPLTAAHALQQNAPRPAKPRRKKPL